MMAWDRIGKDSAQRLIAEVSLKIEDPDHDR